MNAGWLCAPLKYCVNLINEAPVPSSDAARYVGLEHVESWTGRLTGTPTEQMEDAQASAFSTGDVLFGKLRPYLAKAVLAEEDGICSGELLVLRPRRVHGRFLLYWLLTPTWVSLIDSSTYGTKMPRANWSFVGRQVMPVPLLDEQRLIADFLDRETEKIDALVAKKQRLIELLEEKRIALISHAVTIGLDPDVPMKDSGAEWLGTVPSQWSVQPLGRHLRRITYGFTNPMPQADDGPYMLTANDIGDGEIHWDSARRTTERAFAMDLTDKSRPRRGDVLVTKDGTLGRVAVVDSRRACVNQSVAVLQCAPSVLPAYLQYVLRAAPYQWKMLFDAGGTAIKHIYITRLAKMPVAIPSLGAQSAIRSYLRQATEKSGAAVTVVRHALDRLTEYRCALITAAVTGQIDVRTYRTPDPEKVACR